MTIGLRRVVTIGVPAIALVLIAWMCIFKVGDLDFFWHVKAGQLMRETGSIIHTDPFAYTRVGQPYLATHEWLAQVIISLFFDLGGVTGILILRLLLTLGSFALLLSIDFKKIWVNALLSVFAAAGMLHLITDRPHLFTFFLFALTFVTCIHYFQIESIRRRRRISYFFPVIILIWANVHGAAAVIGIGMIGALFLQRLTSLGFSGFRKAISPRQELFWILGSLIFCCIALLLTPSGFDNISYLLSLTSDRTADFIMEWQPAPLAQYLIRYWYLWIISIVSLWFGHKNILWSVIMLISMGVLSRSALRHEPLFVFTALGIIFHQLRYSEKVDDWIEKILKQRVLALVVVITALLGAGYYVHRISYDLFRQDQLYGTGMFEPGKSAVDFLEQNPIEGNMFNSYEIGGYLLFRDHQVFLDGRNVDYGYDYIKSAMDAKKNPLEWNSLATKYNITHAVIYYGDNMMQRPMPYAGNLDFHPEWKLVYLDDWVAIYAKVTAENQSLIQKFGYSAVTPLVLEDQQIPPQLTLTQFEQLKSELQRVINSSPEGIKGYLYMAKLAMMVQQYDSSRILLEKASERQPNNYRSYFLLAELAIEEGDWKEAEKQLDLAIKKAGYTNAVIDQEFVETVRSNARNS